MNENLANVYLTWTIVNLIGRGNFVSVHNSTDCTTRPVLLRAGERVDLICKSKKVNDDLFWAFFPYPTHVATRHFSGAILSITVDVGKQGLYKCYVNDKTMWHDPNFTRKYTDSVEIVTESHGLHVGKPKETTSRFLVYLGASFGIYGIFLVTILGLAYTYKRYVLVRSKRPLTPTLYRWSALYSLMSDKLKLPAPDELEKMPDAASIFNDDFDESIISTHGNWHTNCMGCGKNRKKGRTYKIPTKSRTMDLNEKKNESNISLEKPEEDDATLQRLLKKLNIPALNALNEKSKRRRSTLRRKSQIEGTQNFPSSLKDNTGQSKRKFSFAYSTDKKSVKSVAFPEDEKSVAFSGDEKSVALVDNNVVAHTNKTNDTNLNDDQKIKLEKTSTKRGNRSSKDKERGDRKKSKHQSKHRRENNDLDQNGEATTSKAGDDAEFGKSGKNADESDYVNTDNHRSQHGKDRKSRKNKSSRRHHEDIVE